MIFPVYYECTFFFFFLRIRSIKIDVLIYIKINLKFNLSYYSGDKF